MGKEHGEWSPEYSSGKGLEMETVESADQMADSEEAKGETIEQEETTNREEERNKTYKCQYCDRMFTSSQALGGHQNGHRRERDAAKRAEHEAELYNMHATTASTGSFLHPNPALTTIHTTRTQFQPLLPSPFRSMMPRPAQPSYYQHYQHHLAPYNYNNNGTEAMWTRVDPSYNTPRRPNFLGSPFGGEVLVHPREEQWRPATYFHRSHNPNSNPYPTPNPNYAGNDPRTSQALAMEEPSTSTNLTLGLIQDSFEGLNDNNAVSKEVDLTLHL
ncbi:hypothetical protein Cni_G26118 [Canna indica]|uniref:C2H2-type domain-containing protein n=1 Tax=Canna indica TaxID=4628 RepID=A0AAQ3L5H5_9LILI|nr:hypothetical protein Cni_G26118 [Canna indica]